MTKLDKQDELLSDFISENKDPISAYYDYIFEKVGSKQSDVARWIDGRTTEDVYSEYVKWCEQAGIRPDTNKTFTLRFSKKLPSYVIKRIKKLSGQVYNIYMVNGAIPNE